MNCDQIEFCLLQEVKSLKNFLKDELGLSSSFLKKFKNQKTIINKEKRARELVTLPIDIMNAHLINPEYIGKKIENIFEDDIFLVINKNENQHCYPHYYHENNNCLSFLRDQGRGPLLQVNFEHQGRGLLNRLDFGTSGVLIYVKNDDDYNILRDQFHQIIKEKEYVAIVHGKLDKKGIQVHFLTPSDKKGRKMNVTKEAINDRSLRSELNIIGSKYCSKSNLSLVKIKIITGVRHQIRAQLAQLGHSILGDELYGGERSDRMMLHAFRYSFYYKNNDYRLEATNVSLFSRFFDLNSIF